MSQGRINSPPQFDSYQSQPAFKKPGAKRNVRPLQHIPRTLRTVNAKMNKSENNIHGIPGKGMDEMHILASNDE
jgi:hypothetical protein